MKARPLVRKKEHLHDAVFKAFFSDVQIAQSYLLHYTPPVIHEQIDFSFLRKIDATFVSGRFGISFSDVLYETQLTGGGAARLLFLFEHKSYLPQQPIHLQLLDYLLQIWEDDLKNNRSLSCVIPIVVYHGEKTWKQKPFRDYVKGVPEDWKLFIPEFHYLLSDLSQIPPLTILEKSETSHLKNLFLALKFARNKALIRENWQKIFTFGTPFSQEDRERILLQTLTLYIFDLFQMTQTEFKEINEQLSEPEQDLINSIPEIFGRRWRREGMRKGLKEGRKKGLEIGLAEGRAEGKAEGRAEGKAEAALALNRNITRKTLQKFPDWSDAEVAAFVEVSVELVQQIRLELASGA